MVKWVLLGGGLFLLALALLLPLPAPPPPPIQLSDLPRSLRFPDLERAADQATWNAFSWTATPATFNANVVALQDDRPPTPEPSRHLLQHVEVENWHPVSDEALLASQAALQLHLETPDSGIPWKRRRAELQRLLDWNAWVHRHRPSMERWRADWRAEEIERRNARIQLRLDAGKKVRDRQRDHRATRSRQQLLLGLLGVLLIGVGGALRRR